MYDGYGKPGGEISYRIEITLTGGTLKLEESGTVAVDSRANSEVGRRAEGEVRRALEAVCRLIMGRLGSGVVGAATATAVPEVAVANERPGVPAGKMDDRWLLRVGEAALLGVSRSKMYEMIASRQVPSVTLGSSKRVPVKVLKEWLEEQGRERSWAA